MIVIVVLFVTVELFLPSVGKQAECGVPKVFPKKQTDKQMYMFNGDDVPSGMFPWIGYLTYKDPKSYAECTATLVTPRLLVSAAHCVIGECAKKAFVILGTVRREDTRRKNIYKVEEFLYPKATYKKKNRTVPVHDIAVIKLKRDADISGSNGNINIICLPTTDQELKGALYLSGWGLTDEEALNPADTLKYIMGEVIVDGKCYDDDSKFCVLGKEKKQTPFRGDSGGPAQMLINGKYYLHGALSGGNKTISLYTPIKNYLDWIENQPEASVDASIVGCKPKTKKKH